MKFFKNKYFIAFVVSMLSFGLIGMTASSSQANTPQSAFTVMNYPTSTNGNILLYPSGGGSAIGSLSVFYDGAVTKARLNRINGAAGVAGYTYVDICLAKYYGGYEWGCDPAWAKKADYGYFANYAGDVVTAPYAGNPMKTGRCVIIHAYMQWNGQEAGGSTKNVIYPSGGCHG